MKLLREGRASEIFDLGDGKVLRRYKRGGCPTSEADLMQAARRGGVRCPEVFDVLPDGLVLERVDGATMHETVTRNPSGGALARSAVELAALHDAVHSVTLDGAALTHGDLHWKNVIESPHGPVMLDWANAGWGSADVDVALTWVILATSGGDLGRMLAERFADVVDTTTARRQAAARRLADRGLSSTERRAVTALLG